MNFVQLCEELITETELLEEALNALLSDPFIKRLAQDMKDFEAEFKIALKSAKPENYAHARQEQLGWRAKLEQAILNAFTRISSKASKKLIKTRIDWKELDDYIIRLVSDDKASFNPLRLLHSSNFGEIVRDQIQST